MKKEKNRKIIWIIIAAICASVACAAAIYIISALTPNTSFEKYKKEEAVTTAAPETEADTTDAPETEPPLPENPIDFEGLKKQNPDVRAWITVPGTQVDYPIVCTEVNGDEYYLRRDWLGNYDVCGCIFMQALNSLDFSDPNTVIYGHYMWDGTFFGDLHKFRDESFFNENKEFYIYLPGHKLTYEIFAAYEYDSRHILYSYNFADPEEVKEYFATCLDPKTMYRNVREGVSLSEEDKIITLSTCVQSGDDNKRYLVQGVFVSDEKTK